MLIQVSEDLMIPLERIHCVRKEGDYFRISWEDPFGTRDVAVTGDVFKSIHYAQTRNTSTASFNEELLLHAKALDNHWGEINRLKKEVEAHDHEIDKLNEIASTKFVFSNGATIETGPTPQAVYRAATNKPSPEPSPVLPKEVPPTEPKNVKVSANPALSPNVINCLRFSDGTWEVDHGVGVPKADIDALVLRLDHTDEELYHELNMRTCSNPGT